jgi:hypothetical protein
VIASLPPVVLFVGACAGVALALAWLFVPFAVMGTKPLLRRMIEAQAETNELLERVLARLPERPRDR